MTSSQQQTTRFARVCHPDCIACRAPDEGGLGLSFAPQLDGSVVADYACDPGYQGYPDRLHGGIIALLLDAAMTHCLFAQGQQGVTARLAIRYAHPVELEVPATVHAAVVRVRGTLRELEASIQQGGVVRATASGCFLLQSEEESAWQHLTGRAWPSRAQGRDQVGGLR
jgi:acyl-coenzyme A thioesterase PaaI-like protein